MWNFIKQIFQISWRLIRGKDLMDIDNIFGEEKVSSSNRNLFRTGEMRYSCWGCGKTEYISKMPKPTVTELENFWHRWGPVEKSLKIIFAGDGSYTVESFCPECSEIVETHAGQYRFGYLAADLKPLLRGYKPDYLPR